MLEAIVLAGGLGTRLSHVLSDVPKPMASVCGRPFLRYILDNIIMQGIDKIILAVGYKQECICSYFGNSYRGAQIIYSSENKPLHTGGAIKKAIMHCNQKNVFIVNGDTYFDVDLIKMLKFHKYTHGDITIATKIMSNFDRYGTVKKNCDRVVAFEEKKPTSCGIINGGIYLLNKDLLNIVDQESFSFEREILEKHVNDLRVCAFESDGYFIDIGVPTDYLQAQSDFKNRINSAKAKAAFFDRDGTINVDVGYLHKKEDLIFIKGRPELIRKFNKSGYWVIVITNQAGIARGYYTEDDMRELHKYMNMKLAKFDAHIDAFYYCPHHPDFTGPCKCRKPETGMIQQAINDFDLDPSQCVLYGNQRQDIEAGEKCGIRSIMLTTN